MTITYDFSGQVALVTGAASGMGLAAARAFANAGAAVALADIRADVLDAATQELAAAGHRVIGLAGDISDEAYVKSLVEKTVKTFGRLDAAFNNAGIQSPAVETADVSSEVFDRINAINLRGVWLCMKYELIQMRKAMVRSSTTRLSAAWSVCRVERLTLARRGSRKRDNAPGCHRHGGWQERRVDGESDG